MTDENLEHDPSPRSQKATRSRWQLAIVIVIGITCVPVAVRFGQNLVEESEKIDCKRRLAQVGLGLHNYRDIHGAFPPAAIVDADGRPLHSWRVLIVPFLEQNAFFDQYHLEQPWNGPKNNRLLRECVMANPKGMDDAYDITGVRHCYQCPSAADAANAFRTNYMMIVDDRQPLAELHDSSLEPLLGRHWKARLPVDGGILVVEVENSGIHWMEPRDLSLEEIAAGLDDPHKASLSHAHVGGAFVLKPDGAVEFLDRQVIESRLRELLTSNP